MRASHHSRQASQALSVGLSPTWVCPSCPPLGQPCSFVMWCAHHQASGCFQLFCRALCLSPCVWVCVCLLWQLLGLHWPPRPSLLPSYRTEHPEARGHLSEALTEDTGVGTSVAGSPLPLTTGNDSLDITIVKHLQYCTQLIQVPGPPHLGHLFKNHSCLHPGYKVGKVSCPCEAVGAQGWDRRHAGVGWWPLTPARSVPIISILAHFKIDLTCELWGTWHQLPREAEGQGSGGQGHPLPWVTNSCWLHWEVLSGAGSQLKQPMSSEVKQEPCPHCLTEPQMSLQRTRAEMNFCTWGREILSATDTVKAAWDSPPGTSKLSVHAHNWRDFSVGFFFFFFRAHALWMWI